MVKLSHAHSSPTCREFENQFLRTLGHPGHHNPKMNMRRTGSPVFTLAGLLFHLISFLRSPGPDSYPWHATDAAAGAGATGRHITLALVTS